MKSLTGTLVYCMVDKARPCWDKEKGNEWKCGVVITDEDTADAFDELYPKQTANKVKRTEFKEIYHIDPPEGEGKNVWVVTLKKNEKLHNGEPVPDKYRPRVFEQQGKNRVDVTFTKLPANGSIGKISIDHYAGEKGNIARLKNVLVTEMIEYVAPEGSNYESGSEFDEVEVADKDIPKSAFTKTKETPAKPATKKVVKKEADEFDSDDSPF